jgi:hypothetical protein
MHFQVKLLEKIYSFQLKVLKHSFGMTNYVMGEAGAAFAVTNDYNKLL